MLLWVGLRDDPVQEVAQQTLELLLGPLVHPAEDPMEIVTPGATRVVQEELARFLRVSMIQQAPRKAGVHILASGVRPQDAQAQLGDGFRVSAPREQLRTPCIGCHRATRVSETECELAYLDVPGEEMLRRRVSLEFGEDLPIEGEGLG
jgi:hypothetical protein